MLKFVEKQHLTYILFLKIKMFISTKWWYEINVKMISLSKNYHSSGLKSVKICKLGKPHWLSLRVKLTFFEIFLNGVAPNDPAVQIYIF